MNSPKCLLCSRHTKQKYCEVCYQKILPTRGGKCKKVSYPTKKGALTALNFARKQRRQRRPRRIYKCPTCKHYHLTSKK